MHLVTVNRMIFVLEAPGDVQPVALDIPIL